MKSKEAARLLDECEQNLRRLVAEAAGSGDYSDVLRITDWAKGVAALAAEARTGGAGAGAEAVAAQQSLQGPRHSPLPRAAGTNGRVHVRDTYPKFFRRGDELIKVGWSKKERKEYSHRAPRRAVDAVAAAVKQAGARGKLFTGDTLIPLKDPSDGAALPDYQVYVSLSWLTNLGVLEQRGRRAGYAVVPHKQIDSTITAAWPALEAWRG